MKPHYDNGRVTLWHGDCLNVLTELADNSIDSIVTDPPYGLSNTTPAQVADTIIRWVGGERDYLPKSRGFMGATWDGFVPPVAVWDECMRILKPGGHMAVFAGSRTQDLMGLAIRLAGFDLRDSVAWLYGSGFPKSLDVSKAIDKRGGNSHLADRIGAAIKAARVARGWTTGQADRHFCGGSTNWTWYEGRKGVVRPPTPDDFARIATDWPELAAYAEMVAEADREVVTYGKSGAASIAYARESPTVYDVTAPATPDAERWQGWGTALKPGHEPIILARKPFPSTVAANVQEWGTGALNIDATRIGDGADKDDDRWYSWERGGSVLQESKGMHTPGRVAPRPAAPQGRWPANVALDETMEPVLLLRYNIPKDIERTIREFYGASTSHLSAVPDADHGPSVQGEPSKVLLEEMSRIVDVREPDRRESTPMGAPAHSREQSEDEPNDEGQGSNRREFADMEGRQVPEPGIRVREAEHVATGRTGVVPVDVDHQRRHLYPGTSVSGGAQYGPSAVVVRDSASPEWAQGRQPAGEPGAPQVERFTQDEACGSGRRDVPITQGERTATGAPLKVLRRECPPGWRQYFDVVGHKREGQAEALDQQSGESPAKPSRTGLRGGSAWHGKDSFGSPDKVGEWPADIGGGASRFFFVAPDLPVDDLDARFMYTSKAGSGERPRIDGVAHSTVKPLSLLRWLVRLITPPGGTVLDPFGGSGTTAEAAILERFRAIVIEREGDFLPLIVQRVIRRVDPVEAIRQAGGDLGLFE